MKYKPVLHLRIFSRIMDNPWQTGYDHIHYQETVALTFNVKAPYFEIIDSKKIPQKYKIA